MRRDEILNILHEHRIDVGKFGVKSLAIFGSVARDQARPDSDIYPQVDWRRIAGLRDVIAHGYFGLNEHVLWDLVQKKCHRC